VTDEGVPAPKIDTSVQHSARIWNYWLGGKENYLVDREAGDKYRETYPQIVDVARAGRHFLARAVRFLAAEACVRQFIDVGADCQRPITSMRTCGARRPSWLLPPGRWTSRGRSPYC